MGRGQNGPAIFSWGETEADEESRFLQMMDLIWLPPQFFVSKVMNEHFKEFLDAVCEERKGKGEKVLVSREERKASIGKVVICPAGWGEEQYTVSTLFPDSSSSSSSYLSVMNTAPPRSVLRSPLTPLTTSGSSDELDELRHFVQGLDGLTGQEKLNEAFAEMDLMLCNEALQHFARVCQVIEQTTGNRCVLLVGFGGSQKRSRSQLGICMLSNDVMTILVNQFYDCNTLKLDLEEMYTHSVVRLYHFALGNAAQVRAQVPCLYGRGPVLSLAEGGFERPYITQLGNRGLR
uniref:Dynein heavy chain AAA module D4 domain-containing protein n=1 Tax=Chromera velia CCMP2878 TaxID=1169474 RepID=A0A0G4HLI7_9ALVE|eukprot:Cvel_7360.t1-p1 / transcript=Cvel_7360.t1 / gene=Cvel_7360 / organism=Chromera_velia_CCMP2878 / gene_product=Dynein heavy chain 10, axonemal, putative / transcript_product=Dynein heavy chain 10, axonemal, putative / location=Cvel_scaffold382:39903-40858(-) / protein_length=290 / sequence_SO=supercontig / SO=protein_coding / is_pseudo=false